jgi:hypothetical protein
MCCVNRPPESIPLTYSPLDLCKLYLLTSSAVHPLGSLPITMTFDVPKRTSVAHRVILIAFLLASPTGPTTSCASWAGHDELEANFEIGLETGDG